MFDADFLDEYDPFDVAEICSNCKYDGADYKCLSPEKKHDMEHGCMKDCSQKCVYFVQQDWITKEQEEYMQKQNQMEEKAKQLLTPHGGLFIKMVTECKVLWKNKNGTERITDVAVLSNMSERAWNYWMVN